jgi:hypothetical protein
MDSKQLIGWRTWRQNRAQSNQNFSAWLIIALKQNDQTLCPNS